MQIKFITLVVAALVLTSCSSFGSRTNPDEKFGDMYQGGSSEMESKIEKISNPNDMENTDTKIDAQLAPPKVGDTIATIETSMGMIKMKFHEEAAPELSKNFQELAKKGYYDGVIFHRVIKGFMIQSGDPEGTGMGGESYTGKGLADEEGALKLKHYAGAVASAKSSKPNSIGSQFYIVHTGAHMLDGNYSVFGQVFEGQEVVNKIAEMKTGVNDRPVEEVKITKVTVGEYSL